MSLFDLLVLIGAILLLLLIGFICSLLLGFLGVDHGILNGLMQNPTVVLA